MTPHRSRSHPATTVVSGGGGGGPAFTDTFSLGIKVTDSSVVPTDTGTFAIALLKADSNAAQTETASLNIKNLGDTSTAPTDSQVFTLRVWLSGSVNTLNVTNPGNADGDSTSTAVSSQQSVATDPTHPTSTMTSTLGPNIPAGISVASAVYRGWFKVVNVLVTSATSIVMHSTSALFTDVTMYTWSTLGGTDDHLSGNFTFDLVAAGINTSAKLSSCQVLHKTVDAAAGVTPAVLTVNAGAVDLAGAF